APGRGERGPGPRSAGCAAPGPDGAGHRPSPAAGGRGRPGRRCRRRGRRRHRHPRATALGKRPLPGTDRGLRRREPMNRTGRLLRLLAPFRWGIGLAVVLSFATVGSSVGLMATSAYLISRAALATSPVELSLALAGVRLFALSRAALRYAERIVSHTITFRVLTRLRVWFYTAIEPLAPARLAAYRSGDLLARVVNDIET